MGVSGRESEMGVEGVRVKRVGVGVSVKDVVG